MFTRPTHRPKRLAVSHKIHRTAHQPGHKGRVRTYLFEQLEDRRMLAAVPTIQINDVEQVEGDSGTSNFVFTITRTGKSNQPSTVDYVTAPGTATEGADYQDTSGTVVFDSGQKTKTIAVQVNGDTAVEPDETFYVDLTIVDNGQFGDSRGVGTIQNDDTGPSVPALSIDDVELAEGNSGTTAFVFTVTRSGDTSGTSTVDFATADGSAASGTDYIAASGTVQFLATESTQTITIDINGDSIAEPHETFFVNLSNETGATITDAQGQGTLADDDAVPTISFPDFSDSTGLTLVGDAAIAGGNTLRLTPAAGGMEGAAWYSLNKQFASVDWETTFDFNLNENVDPPGGSDGFVFVIQNHDPAYLAGGGGTLGYNNLPNSLAIEFDTFQNSEVNDPSQSHISVHTNGTGPNSWDESLSLGSYSTPTIMDDAATHTARISYSPGTLRVFLDDLTNPVLTVAVDLGATLDLDAGQAWVGFTSTTGGGWQNHDILNWDYRVLADTSTTISIGDAEVIEGDTGTVNMLLNVDRLGDTTGTTTVNWATADDTATAGIDYVPAAGQLVFDPGETEQTIVVTVSGDVDLEGHETFFVDLAAPSGGIVSDGRATGTILNDDATVSVSDTSAQEGEWVGHLADVVISPAGSPVDSPKGMRFYDGDLYVTSAFTNSVLAYDGVTFEFLDEFVAPGAGGLDRPIDLQFHADVLYVSSAATHEVLMFDATTGSSLGALASSGFQGLNRPSDLLVHDGDLYIASWSGEIHRYDLSTGLFKDKFVDASAGLIKPTGMVFIPSGQEFLVADNQVNNVLRFDASTGALLGELVAPLDVSPGGIGFAADGSLLVVGHGSNDIRRFDGTTGAYLNDYVSDGAGGLTGATRFVTRGNELFVAGQGVDSIFRFSYGPAAVATISLSAASGLPITVDYTTTDGTAQAGTDYLAASGTVTFLPGQTTKGIIVSTVNDADEESDETLFINLTAATAAAILDNQGEATIHDDDAPTDVTKFYVVDDSVDDMYEYRADGSLVTNYNLGSGNNSPRGAAATATGDTVWVIDNDDHVYVHDNDGNLLREWKANGLSQPEGIATDGTDVWIVDRGNDRVHFFAGGAMRTSDTSATSSFSLVAGNPRGVTTDGTSLWVVDTGTDDVYKYTVNGTLLGNWALDSRNTVPRGITIDPGNVSDIWVIDSTDDDIYEYTAAASRTSGSQSAANVYDLAAGNSNPQGIADPPPAIPAPTDPSVEVQRLVDAYFALTVWDEFRPSGDRTDEIRSSTQRSYPDANPTRHVSWSPALDARGANGKAERLMKRIQAGGADKALELLADEGAANDLLGDLR